MKDRLFFNQLWIAIPRGFLGILASWSVFGLVFQPVALIIAGISIGLHMILGSVIAVMGVAIPAFLAFTSTANINPLVPTFLVYSSIALHYIFPFHHLNMLVGLGEDNGMYKERHVIKLGIPLTAVVIITVLFEVVWWQITGLL